MAQSQSGFDVNAYNHDLDELLANVMPESWPGHARIATFEAADDLGDDATAFAVKLAGRLAPKHPAHPTEAIVKAAIRHTNDRF